MPDNNAPRGASVELKGLTKDYGSMLAVDHIDLTARPGEFLTLLGPSGSGKTTTLNMIAGFEPVTSGELLIDGKPVQSLPPYKREIGMVFQHYALFPHMSVSQNVEYPLKQRKFDKTKRRDMVRSSLEAVGLEDFGSRMPRQLSGGQQQRVALARAMVYNPSVLLMDEPLGALDKKLRDSLQLEIKRIHHELGTTFVYVTHDQDEALVLSDRIAVFNNGKIEQVGTAKELYDRPETLFVAQFLGESSMFRGTVSQVTADGVVVDTPDGQITAARGDLNQGDDAAVVVRPERIHVSTDPAAGGNVVRGRVRQEIYLGAARKLEMVLSDGSLVLVREPASMVSEAAPGQEVAITFRPVDAAALSPTKQGHTTAAEASEDPAATQGVGLRASRSQGLLRRSA